MTLPDRMDLLRSIYRRLDRSGVRSDFPGMTDGDLDDFFQHLARIVQKSSPPPADAPGGGHPMPSTSPSPKTVAVPQPAEKQKKGQARNAIVYTDGGARGNPGPAGYGYALFDEKGAELGRGKQFVGDNTNNAAEYLGVMAGLEAALEAGAERVTVRTDSQLIARQLNGSYRVKAPGLKGLFAQAQGLLSQFASWRIEHVPREQNRLADALANEAMDEGAKGVG